MSLKRLCRMFATANNDFPSLQSEISTLFAAGNAASRSDLCTTIPYFMSLFTSIQTLQDNLSFSLLCNSSLLDKLKLSYTYERKSDGGQSIKFKYVKNLKESKHLRSFIIFNMLRPGVLGGWPIQLMSKIFGKRISTSIN